MVHEKVFMPILDRLPMTQQTSHEFCVALCPECAQKEFKCFLNITSIVPWHHVEIDSGSMNHELVWQVHGDLWFLKGFLIAFQTLVISIYS